MAADSTIDWMIALDASGATATLAKFANLTKEKIAELSDTAKQKNFLDAMRDGIAKSPAIQEALLQFAAVEKSALGVAAAIQLAARHTEGFDDLNNQLKEIDELFKNNVVSAGVAQEAIGKVADAGADRAAQAARDKIKADQEASAKARQLAKEDADYAESLRRADIELDNQVMAARERDRKEEMAKSAADYREMQTAKKLAADKAESDEKSRAAKRSEDLRGLKLTAVGMGLGAAAMIGSHARSGFADSLQGQQADVYGQLLNRQVASIFAPLLEEKTKYVSQMTSWLQGLHEPQRESIRQMTVFATSMGTLGFVLPKVTKGIAAAMGAGERGMGAAGPVGIALAIAGSVLGSTKEGRESLAGLAKAMMPVANLVAGLVTSFTPLVADIASVATWIKDRVPDSNSTFLGIRSTSNSPSRQVSWFGDIFESPEVRAQNQRRKEQADWDYSRSRGWAATGPRPLDLTPSSGSLVSPIPKGSEEIEQTFWRILESATKINIDQQQLTALHQIEQNTRPQSGTGQSWVSPAVVH